MIDVKIYDGTYNQLKEWMRGREVDIADILEILVDRHLSEYDLEYPRCVNRDEDYGFKED